MSIVHRIYRGTLSVAAATLLARVGTFAGNIAIIRLLPGEMVGQLGLVESWVGVALVFATLGINAAATKYISEYLQGDRARVGSVVGAALLLSACAGSVAALVVCCGFGWGWWKVGGAASVDLRAYAPVVATLVVAQAMRATVNGIVYGCEAFSSLVAPNIVVGLVSFPVMYLLARERGLAGALEARLALTALEAALLARVAWAALGARGVRAELRGSRAQARRLLSFGLPVVAGSVAAGPVQPMMMSLLAAQPGGLEQLALITTASRLCSLLNFLPGAIAPTLVPIFSGGWGSGDREEFRRSLALTLRLFWLGTLPLIVLCLAATPLLLGSLYGRAFVAAWPVAFLLLLISMLANLNQSADYALEAAGRVWLSTSNSFAWLLAFVPLALWWIPHAGAVGYASAFCATFALYAALQMWWLRRVFALSLKPIALMVAATAPFVAGAALVATAAPPTLQPPLGLALAALAAWFESRFLLTPDEKAALAQRVRARLGRRPLVVAPDGAVPDGAVRDGAVADGAVAVAAPVSATISGAVGPGSGRGSG